MFALYVTVPFVVGSVALTVLGCSVVLVAIAATALRRTDYGVE